MDCFSVGRYHNPLPRTRSPECWNCMTGMSPHFIGFYTVQKQLAGFIVVLYYQTKSVNWEDHQ